MHAISRLTLVAVLFALATAAHADDQGKDRPTTPSPQLRMSLDGAWLLTGNPGTISSQNFLGTIDFAPLELRVNGSRAFRLEPVLDSEAGPNLIGGSPANSVAGGIIGATIAGGGTLNFPNLVTGAFGTVGGGCGNLAGPEPDQPPPDIPGCGADLNLEAALSAESKATRAADLGTDATVAGGAKNKATGTASFVGGGQENEASGIGASVAGGLKNKATRGLSTVGGGLENEATGPRASVAGGRQNKATGDDATVGGGLLNEAGGAEATVGGGRENKASGVVATVPGGWWNEAGGAYSLAAGFRAKANHNGAFVWADSAGSDFASTAVDQFSARATGGVRFVSAINAAGAPTAGVTLAAGGNAWAAISDRNLKKNLREIDGEEILTKLGALPVSRWNYVWEPDGAVPHIGPMAQDFKAAFYPGRDNTTITTFEADGVHFAALQALERRTAELKRENEELKAQIAELKALVQNSVLAGKTRND